MTGGIVTGRDPATGGVIKVTVSGGRIAAIEPSPADDACWISPGLIDMQVNGYAGHDLNSGALTAETVSALCRAMRASGVTTFLPTLVTAAESSITHALCAIAAARQADSLAAQMIPFVHVEGPHISPEDGPRGAHPRKFARPADVAEFERWQAASGGLAGLVTLSPHDDAALAYIAALAGRGIRVAIGHTHAAPAQIRAAVDAGARFSTHLGNGVAALLPRHPNLIWSQLAEDRLAASFIADGHHLPDDTLCAMLRAKSLARSMLVSDLTALGGMPPGRYRSPIGGEVELSADGRLGIPGTPYLAGAARTLADGVAHAIVAARLTLAEALSLATVNPGRALGGGGALRVGAHADLIRFRWTPGDRSLAMETVLVAGESV